MTDPSRQRSMTSVAFDGARIREFAFLLLPLLRLDKEFRERPPDEFLASFVSEHLHKSGIDIFELAIGCGEVDAFLERLEEFSKAGLAFAFLGDVARDDAESRS